jgi:hypothetical protein
MMLPFRGCLHEISGFEASNDITGSYMWISHVRLVSFQHDMARPHVAGGGDGLRMVAANIVNMHSRTADKGWSSSSPQVMILRAVMCGYVSENGGHLTIYNKTLFYCTLSLWLVSCLQLPEKNVPASDM